MTAGSVAVPTIIPLKAPHGPKHLITSNTPIELHSDTDGCVVLYAVDGSRPEASFKQGRLHIPKTTFLYKGPFLLPTGRVFVKALAMLKDASRQSSVVTKRFTVYEGTTSNDDESTDEQVLAPPPAPSPRPSLSSQLKHRLTMSSRTSLTEPPSTSPPQTPPPEDRPPSRQWGQRAVTADKPTPCCVYCKAPRPKAPSYKYCTHCGYRLPPLVDSKLPLQLSVCSGCRAELPPDTSTCPVCEGRVERPPPIHPILGQTTTHQDVTTCLSCGTTNSSHLTHCVTCERPIVCEEDTPPPPTLPHPPLPAPAIMRPVCGSSYMMCGVCGRVNVSDARFCDWCGSKPEGCELSVMCAGCSTGNEWSSRHCYACGGLIKAPLRPDVELAQSMKMPAIAERDKNTWIPVVEIADRGPELSTIGTQTAGIFYPSSTTLHKAEQSQGVRRAMHAGTRDRLPELQQCSPGHGLWRMAVKHVSAHFRAHTLSSAQLQAQLGQPQLGKLVAATTEQTEDHFNLQLTFELPESGSNLSSSHLNNTTPILYQTTPIIQKTTPIIQETAPTKQSINRRPSTDKKLKGDLGMIVKELSSNGQGRGDIIRELIDKGIDVNATEVSGVPLLSLAASNGHVESVSVLLELGATVNTAHKLTGNTALHQAVMAGSVDCVETLLGHSANPRLQNKQGLNPCELALKLNYDELVSCFATYVGIGLLDKISNAQPSLTV